MQRLCVFCGAANGSQSSFKLQAIELGKKLVADGLDLVYGGGHVGLMGVLADTVLEAGGKVIGVIPEDLVTKELAHQGLTELKIVKSLAQRKAMMLELSDGFIAIPGGYGTVEEFCEMLTGSMLGLHKKPCGLLNTNGYYDHLLKFFDNAVQNHFVSVGHRSLILVSQSPEDLIERMKSFKHNIPARWFNGAESGSAGSGY